MYLMYKNVLTFDCWLEGLCWDNEKIVILESKILPRLHYELCASLLQLAKPVPTRLYPSSDEVGYLPLEGSKVL